MQDLNNPSQQRLLALMDKVHRNEATPEERMEIDRWYASFSDAPRYRDGLDATERLAVKNRLMNRINEEIKPFVGTPRRFLWKSRSWAAAIALFVLTAGIMLYFNIQQPADTSQTNAVSLPKVVYDHAPGTNRATLTYGDGHTVDLSSEQTGIVVADQGICYTNGTALLEFRSKRSEPHEATTPSLTLTTPRGGQYQITLEDGTRVWLNADSKLQYPTTFKAGHERRVYLSGEAYFEVAKNPTKPFIVESDQQYVQVLGTHFNISTYPDEALIKTTLSEGAVRVTQKKTGVQKQLQPGQQAQITAGSIRVVSVDPEEAIAWKNGLFYFKQEKLGSMMKKIARWYDVDVTFTNPALKDIAFVGIIDRFSQVSDVLQMLEKTGDATFEITEKQIIVKPKK